MAIQIFRFKLLFLLTGLLRYAGNDSSFLSELNLVANHIKCRGAGVMQQKVDVAHSYSEACSIELERVPVTWINRLVQLRMWLYLLLYRTLLWVLRRGVLGLRTPTPLIQPREIIVYLQGMLGDVSVHLPAVMALRVKFPAARLICVCYSEGFPIAGLLEGLPYIDQLIVLDKHPVIRQGTKLIYSSSALEELSADLFVNFSPFANRGVPGFLAREMVFAKKCGAKFYLGDSLALYGVPIWARQVKRLFVRNEPRRSLRILAPLAIQPVKDTISCLPARAKLPDMSRNFPNLDLLGNYALIHPGAKHAVKLWPAEYYGKIASQLFYEYGLQVLITGSQAEAGIADRVVNASGGVACNLCGLSTLPEMIELIRHARIVITNDTGPMHLSSLLRRPAVAIFGTRMTVRHWYPIGETTTVVMHYHEDSFSYDDDGHVPHRMENIQPEIIAIQIGLLLCAS